MDLQQSISYQLNFLNKQNDQYLSKYNQNTRLRIPQGIILIYDQKIQKSLSSIVCPICHQVLQTPYVSCQNCENNFCNDCINKWWQDQPKACFYRCQNASFKIVEMSKTFESLLKIFKVKCQKCDQPVSISSYESHLIQYCPKCDIVCRNNQCLKIFLRQNLSQHLLSCDYQPQKCSYCCQMVLRKNKLIHQLQKCEQNYKKCIYYGCQRQIKYYQFQKHIQNCLYRIQECRWCLSQFLSRDIFLHEYNCQKNQSKCEFCKTKVKFSNLNDHLSQCKAICDLCESQILNKEKKNHRIKCMYQHLLVSKALNMQIALQTSKLSDRIQIINKNTTLIIKQIQKQAIKNIEILNQLKYKQKQFLMDELKQIDKKIQQTKQENKKQSDKHLGYFHISQFLCPFCNQIKNNLKQKLIPLNEQRDKIIKTIQGLEKIYQETQSIKYKHRN